MERQTRNDLWDSYVNSGYTDSSDLGYKVLYQALIYFNFKMNPISGKWKRVIANRRCHRNIEDAAKNKTTYEAQKKRRKRKAKE
jgi:hypothetical protein